LENKLIVSDVTDQFIILKKTKYQESDLIIQALSKTGNRKSFIAKSALKSKKRFGGGVLEPTHFVQFTYTPTQKESGLNYLKEASLKDDFNNIRSDYDKLEFALQIMNCVYSVAQEGDFNSQFLFNLVGHSLRYLDTNKDLNIAVFKMHFYLKFLYQQGVISMDTWMTPFLKVNISDSAPLSIDDNIKLIAQTYFESIELQVKHYIKSADSQLV
jgi:DNA repair protein RecO (recombination protein O)